MVFRTYQKLSEKYYRNIVTISKIVKGKQEDQSMPVTAANSVAPHRTAQTSLSHVTLASSRAKLNELDIIFTKTGSIKKTFKTWMIKIMSISFVVMVRCSPFSFSNKD